VRDGLIERVLGEYEELGETNGDPQLQAVRTAIFVEDVFGVVLTDGQITPGVVGDYAALRGLLLQLTNRLRCAESVE
jgi:hypothetical protein